MMTLDVLIAILVSYVVTVTVTGGHIMRSARTLFERARVHLFGVHSYEFETCRLCVGFYVSAVATLLVLGFGDTREFIGHALAVWGGSYFLATQERTY